MRASRSFLVAGLGSVMLSGCHWDWDRFLTLPVVCPSSVYLEPTLLPQGALRFRPYVENRGIKDNVEAFNVYMHVTRTSGGSTVEIRKYTFSGANVTIPGTHGVAGVKAGPQVELITTITLESRTISYDPQATYGVTLDFKSFNNTLDLASDGCRHLGPLNFKGGQPV